jgi:hypothetical protein
MAFPVVGELYYGGKINGIGPVVWTQPNGPGTPVSPAAPTQYPVINQGYPQTPFSYEGLFSFPCGHWCNTCEVFEAYDEDNETSAAICCCPVCSYCILIVEPYNEWQNEFFSIYPLGLGNQTFTNPDENPNLPN